MEVRFGRVLEFKVKNTILVRFCQSGRVSRLSGRVLSIPGCVEKSLSKLFLRLNGNLCVVNFGRKKYFGNILT